MSTCGANSLCANGAGAFLLMLIVGLAAIGLLSLMKGKWK